MKTLKALGQPGIFLVSTGVKEVGIYASNNMLNTLSRVLPQLPSNANIKILDSSPMHETHRKIVAGAWVSEYRSKGYTVRSYYKPWSIRVEARRHLPGPTTTYGQYRAYLEAYNSHQSVVLGVFSSLAEAEEFRLLYYKGNKIKALVMANNDCTREYAKENI